MWQDTLTRLGRLASDGALKFLVLGDVTPAQRDEAVRHLRSVSGRDAYDPQQTTPFELPSAATSLVVIDRVGELSHADQLSLDQWLDRHRDTMVLAFSEESLFPLVAQGTLSAQLFYRLNLITLRVDEDA